MRELILERRRLELVHHLAALLDRGVRVGEHGDEQVEQHAHGEDEPRAERERRDDGPAPLEVGRLEAAEGRVEEPRGRAAEGVELLGRGEERLEDEGVAEERGEVEHEEDAEVAHHARDHHEERPYGLEERTDVHQADQREARDQPERVVRLLEVGLAHRPRDLHLRARLLALVLSPRDWPAWPVDRAVCRHRVAGHAEPLVDWGPDGGRAEADDGGE
mmetsp:Transcript_52135/g.153877  ORF Transcript_52135/g.153877 Transcript_52135/m.153877 type:complete len:218 (+) Transcript_52135:1026-1679(+)